MFTCLIKYVVDLNKLDEFTEYAHTWIKLIERYGGVHHGCFLPGNSDDIPDSAFSFPDIGRAGPSNVAIALFSFANVAQYENYRKVVSDDEECKAITARFNKTKCFFSYERYFLQPLSGTTVY